PIRRYDSDIVAFDVDSEKRVKARTAGAAQEKITRQIFVVGIRLDDLIYIRCLKNLVPRDVPTRKTHVYVVCPKDASLPKGLLDKCQRVARNLLLFRHHVTVWRKEGLRTSGLTTLPLSRRAFQRSAAAAC